MRQARRYFDWQHRLIAPELGPRVLEVGCGIGNFTRTIADRECVIGIDVDEGCVEAMRRNLAGYWNVEARHMDVVSSEFVRLSAELPDSIVCLNVLEHIEDDRQALANMHAVLRAGGRAILIVPAFEALYGPIDANLGHYRRYSKRAFRKLAAESGFSVVKLRYMNCAGFFGWWVNARLLKRDRQSEKQIAFFDAVLAPLQERLERLVAVPLGQSLFVVLEKRG